MSAVTLHVAPSPSFHRQGAIIHCLAFSNSPISRWFATTPADAITDREDQIAPFRLSRLTREYAHREFQPGVVQVFALIDGRVVGCAIWGLPKHLYRSETLVELIYRKGIECKNNIEDWMFPSNWYLPERVKKFRDTQEEVMERLLGPVKKDETWYLKILIVHPEFQRRGVGTALLDWGLAHARGRGENVYLEASDRGEPLYLKKGFKELGHLVVGEEGHEASLPCLLWDPPPAPIVN